MRSVKKPNNNVGDGTVLRTTEGQARSVSGSGSSRSRRSCEVPITAMVIVVPARNEAKRLPACLASLAESRRHVEVPVEVVVVLDSCTDDSAEWVSVADRVVVVDVGNVGAARAAGFFASRIASGDRTWLTCTDADSVVPPFWLADHLRLARAGARVVCGTVAVNSWARLGEQTRARYEASYRFGEGHGHVHGANLGVLAREYWAVGGFAALASGEDVDLVRRLTPRGPVLWSGSAPVATSARLRGRAPDGFAAHLTAIQSVQTR